MAKPEHDNQGDDDFTDVTAMADVNIATETEHLATSAEIGTEIRGAPGGDEAASVNKNGEKTNVFGKGGVHLLVQEDAPPVHSIAGAHIC